MCLNDVIIRTYTWRRIGLDPKRIEWSVYSVRDLLFNLKTSAVECLFWVQFRPSVHSVPVYPDVTRGRRTLLRPGTARKRSCEKSVLPRVGVDIVWSGTSHLLATKQAPCRCTVYNTLSLCLRFFTMSWRTVFFFFFCFICIERRGMRNCESSQILKGRKIGSGK